MEIHEQLPIDFSGTVYTNLVERLLAQTNDIANSGHLNAERLIKNACDVLTYLVDQGIIILP